MIKGDCRILRVFCKSDAEPACQWPRISILKESLESFHMSVSDDIRSKKTRLENMRKQILRAMQIYTATEKKKLFSYRIRMMPQVICGPQDRLACLKLPNSIKN